MYLVLATTGEQAAGPIGALFGLFENNLVNWVLLAGLLIWMCTKSLPGVFAAREKSINNAIDEAKKSREEGEAFLKAQKQKVANAEKEAEHILVEAREMADQMKAQIDEETAREILSLEQKVEQQIASERQIAITELRRTASRAAIALAEASLKDALNEDAKKRLMDEFVDQLEAVKN